MYYNHIEDKKILKKRLSKPNSFLFRQLPFVYLDILQ